MGGEIFLLEKLVFSSVNLLYTRVPKQIQLGLHTTKAVKKTQKYFLGDSTICLFGTFLAGPPECGSQL